MDEVDKPRTNLAQRLMFTVARYQQYLSKELKRFDLGLSEYPILIYLVHRHGSERTSSQRDIAQHTFRDPALITRATKKLADKGFITIQPDTDNLARHVLSLTDKGRETALEIDEMVWAWEEKAFSDMTQEERKQLKQLLARLVMSD